MEKPWPARQRPFDGVGAEERQDTTLALEVGGALDEAVKHRQRAAVAKWGADALGAEHREALEHIVQVETRIAIEALRRAAQGVNFGR